MVPHLSWCTDVGRAVEMNAITAIDSDDSADHADIAPRLPAVVSS